MSHEKLIMGHLNINSIQNKFDAIIFIVASKIDIFLICETKIDASSFPAQSVIKGVSNPYSYDRISRREDFSYMHATMYHQELYILKQKQQRGSFEINFRKTKCFLN